MTYPICIPHIGYDGNLNAMIGICLTGMGVDMGRYVLTDLNRDTFLDDEVLTEINHDYLNHEISLVSMIGRVRDYLDDRGGPWGFKFSEGLSLLPIYKRAYPNMSIIAGDLEMQLRYDNILAIAANEDSILSATVPEIAQETEARQYAVQQVLNQCDATIVPHELFEFNRQKALCKLAEHLGADYRTGNIAKLVDSAQRKLLQIYDERSIGSGYVAG